MDQCAGCRNWQMGCALEDACVPSYKHDGDPPRAPVIDKPTTQPKPRLEIPTPGHLIAYQPEVRQGSMRKRRTRKAKSKKKLTTCHRFKDGLIIVQGARVGNRIQTDLIERFIEGHDYLVTIRVSADGQITLTGELAEDQGAVSRKR